MPGRPIAVEGDLTDIPGVPGSLVAPKGMITSITPTVLAGGRPVLTVGAIAEPHGNPRNPRAHGFDPTCACATVSTFTSTTVFVNGKPLALVGPPFVGSTLTCGHVIFGPGVPTVMVGS